MPSPKLLVGATGNQSGALINALLSNFAPFGTVAITRNASFHSAQALTSKPNVTLIQGDATSPASIFEAYKLIYGVFLVMSFELSKENMEKKQALPLIDEALKISVSHLLFASVDRGGAGVSDKSPTEVEYFAPQHQIETCLTEEVRRIQDGMVNIENGGIQGKYWAYLHGQIVSWGSVLVENQLQLVSMHDIGAFAARIFDYLEEYKRRGMSLAELKLTLKGAQKISMETLEYDMPISFHFLGPVWMLVMPKEVSKMFNLFREVGLGADIPALRMVDPNLQDFRPWLKESSESRKQ